MVLTRYLAGLLVSAAMASALLQPSLADDGGKSLLVQLNALKPIGGTCRMSFVMTNRLGVEIKETSLEIVLFNKDDAVARLLAVNPGRLPKDKTRVKQFDIKGIDCKEIGRVLLNDVKRCAGEGLSPAMCLDAVRPSSRVKTPFIS